jgi:hypothetical protein
MQRLAFQADFELVPGIVDKTPVSRFPYGHEASWGELAADVDVPRESTAPLLERIRKSASDETSPSQVYVVLDAAGSGKTTVLKRLSLLLAEGGNRVLFCSALGRLPAATSSLLDLIDGPLVVVIDNLADQVTALSEIIQSIEKRDVAFLCAERVYRTKYLTNVLSGLDFEPIGGLELSIVEAEELIERYTILGAIGDHNILKNKRRFASSIKEDPIAVACCRILNDFRPLGRILSDLSAASSTPDVHRFVCASLAQHCFRSGVRYDILSRTVPIEGLQEQFGGSHPLPLSFSDVRSDYVTPENATIGTALLENFAISSKEDLLNIFVSLAIEVEPFVNRKTIQRRTPEARLAGRLFDFDDVVSRFLGELAEVFYDEVRAYWKWNSRYWEQVALLKLSQFNRQPDQIGFLDFAVQHARHAVALENHPFGLTTLGKVLFVQMSSDPKNKSTAFDEAFERLSEAIDREARWARRAVQPFATLFSGVLQYNALGGVMTSHQRESLRRNIQIAERVFSRQPELLSNIASIRAFRLV